MVGTPETILGVTVFAPTDTGNADGDSAVVGVQVPALTFGCCVVLAEGTDTVDGDCVGERLGVGNWIALLWFDGMSEGVAVGPELGSTVGTSVCERLGIL